MKYHKQTSTVTTHSIGSQDSSHAHPNTQHVVRQPQVTSAVDPATAASLRLIPPPPIESPSVPVKSTLRHQPTRKAVKGNDDFQAQATTIIEEAFQQLVQ
jgi:hypothetical protein